MGDKVTTAFDLQGVTLALDRILPLKRVVSDPKKNSTFRRVLSSIREVGLIEPLIVYPQGGGGKGCNYSLLDGHCRLEAMKQLGFAEAPCLISTDDEAYTYNHKVNVVPPIQEHFMIIKAIENGVSEARIAKALDVDVVSIRQKRDMLNGICAEAVELLKDRRASRDAFRELRKVKPMRQIEMAELMINSHNFTAAYAKCLLATTQDEQLVEPLKKAVKGLRQDEMARMEREMEDLEQDFKTIEDSLGRNTLHLVLTTAYLRRLLDNAAVLRFLSGRHSDILSEFQNLVQTTSLERGT